MPSNFKECMITVDFQNKNIENNDGIIIQDL